MKFSDVGLLRWIFWAYLSWKGVIKRLPYAIGFFALVICVQTYTTAVAQWVAVNIAPPPAGMELNAEYVVSIASSIHIAPFILPVCYIYMALDFKRMRSVGLSALPAFGIALFFSGAGPFMPIFVQGAGQATAMIVFAYHAILAILPAAEDRLSPLERKYKTWQSIATGNGTPCRLSGGDVKEWRIIRQGPEKPEQKKPRKKKR